MILISCLFKNKFGGIKKLAYLCNPDEKRDSSLSSWCKCSGRLVLEFILKNFKNKFGGIKKLAYLCNPNEKKGIVLK